MRILVAEGNEASVRARTKELSGVTPGEGYANVLKFLESSVDTEIICPTDSSQRILPSRIEEYDGVVITGSALNAYSQTPDVTRQRDFCESVFAAGVPLLGSCWGLQIATVAAGGDVQRNQSGREVAFARAVQLTDAGKTHPMHSSRPHVFDAPAIHSDHVTRLPEGAVVTAFNSYSAVQAMTFRQDDCIVWGVQYHPELDMFDIASAIKRYGQRLIDEDQIFSSLEQLENYAAELIALHKDHTRRDIAWRYVVGPEILEDTPRLTEVANWLRNLKDGTLSI